ncbi:MAG TPA: LuxR C-terminal-related transcriptional regulator [Ktedonobacteraceae bacterium]|jgi:DNA-binding NarL/FixJ family response regulator|nr:LuxR C-terminal-related transcriptional regulator [Ktedonobacteraceae bacterium]
MNTPPQQRLLDILSSLLIQVNAVQAQINMQETTAALQADLYALEQTSRAALALARSIYTNEPAEELEHSTLAEALTQLVESTAETLNLSSRIALSGVDEQDHTSKHALPHLPEYILYLIGREALYQLQQRSGVHRIRLTLNYGPDDVQMSLDDDGTLPTNEQTTEPDAPSRPAPPFVPDERLNGQQSNHTIMDDLRIRLAAFGGTLVIEPLAERGTRILARLPYQPHERQLSGEQLPVSTPANIAPPENTKRISVLIVDSLTVTRAGLHRLLETYASIHVIGEAADGVQAVSEALELGPQVVLMDTQLPNGQSIEALKQIKQLNQDTKVLLLSTQDREEYLYTTLRAGADGYVLKDIAPEELVAAIHSVARGEMLVQSQLASRLLARVGRDGGNHYTTLTAREFEVLRLLANGLRNKEIAARLFVSERTVNFHLANIYQKLNVSGRTEALHKAIEQGLITA